MHVPTWRCDKKILQSTYQRSYYVILHRQFYSSTMRIQLFSVPYQNSKNGTLIDATLSARMSVRSVVSALELYYSNKRDNCVD